MAAARTNRPTIAVCHPADLRHALACAESQAGLYRHGRVLLMCGACVLVGGPAGYWACETTQESMPAVSLWIASEDAYTLQHALRNEHEAIRVVWICDMLSLFTTTGAIPRKVASVPAEQVQS